MTSNNNTGNNTDKNTASKETTGKNTTEEAQGRMGAESNKKSEEKNTSQVTKAAPATTTH